MTGGRFFPLTRRKLFHLPWPCLFLVWCYAISEAHASAFSSTDFVFGSGNTELEKKQCALSTPAAVRPSGNGQDNGGKAPREQRHGPHGPREHTRINYACRNLITGMFYAENYTHGSKKDNKSIGAKCLEDRLPSSVKRLSRSFFEKWLT